MTRLLHIACILGCCLDLLQGKPSEYQLEAESRSPCELLRGVAVAKQQGDVPQCTEDGRFRPVQCSGRGQDCWCVDAGGQEVAGTRTNSSAPHCPSPCQLQDILRCSPSGAFHSVQCGPDGTCWCVDREGAELYGTRQAGAPPRCPGTCEVRSRRLLHSLRPHSPPQCGADGGFLPVQCHFINTTDRRPLDLSSAFNRFPDSFQTFSSFRKFFPDVSSYCFCSDSRGREVEDTGVELLLSEVYDSAFSGPVLGSSRSVSQTNVYRVLQRRMLGVRLALTGHFRCPSPCEEERRAASEASSVFVPTCETDGSFSSRQCQQGGPPQCWCVDPTGAELPGTRRRDDLLVCGSGAADCPSQRRRALSRLFFGPVSPPVQNIDPAPPASCPALLRALRGLHPAETDPASFLSQMVQVLQGLFPSVGGALQALAHSSPRRLQENLFGGKFLQNAASFNLSRAVGAEGPLGRDRLSPPNLQKNRDLVRAVSSTLGDPHFLSRLQQALRGRSSSAPLEQVLGSCSEDDPPSAFVPSCTVGGGFQEVQCHGGRCWCVDRRGREVPGSRVSGRRPRCPSHCEQRRREALEVRGNMAAGAELHVPACSEAGDFLPLQCVGSHCFCVDREGGATSAESAGGVVTCPETNQDPRPTAGRCSQAIADVTAFTQEVKRIITLSNSSHIPLGYGFLLARGLRLTPAELQVSQSEEELEVSKLLTFSNSALRLAAFSTVQVMLPRRDSYRPFTPQCDAAGAWSHTQCYHNTGQCWCVDEEGEYIPDSLTSRSTHLPKCLTRCQRAQSQSLLSDWTAGVDSTNGPTCRPQCEEDGRFRVLQTEGAAHWCVNPMTGEPIQKATPTANGQLTCPSWCVLRGSQCRPDGSFLPQQCDVTSCWCVSEDGQEVGGTRRLRRVGQQLSCDRPLCPTGPITHGALRCQPADNGRQSCELICHHGYQNALNASSFLCDTDTRRWDGDDRPVGGACQLPQPLQVVSALQVWSLSPVAQGDALQAQLTLMMTSRGLCSLQLPSGAVASVCDDTPLLLQQGGDTLRLTVRWTAHLSDLPASDLPTLHDISRMMTEKTLPDGVRGLLGDIPSTLVSMTTPTFGCNHGYRPASDGGACVVCPAGSFSSWGVCLPCPQGTYQDQEGRDFCNKCPRGSSPPGAASSDQCATACQRRGLRCSDEGDFLPAQTDFLLGRWRCVNSEGVELDWTDREEPLTDEECSVLSRFQAVPGSDLIIGADETEVLRSMTSDLSSCIHACAAEPSCHHVALFNTHTQCELYSTHTLNTHCNASQPTKGFLGNPQAEVFDWLSCSLKVRGGVSDLLVIRKTDLSSQQRVVRMTMMKALSGVFRTQVFSSRRASLPDAHRFCQDGCSRDACCHGFILNQNSLNGGSVLCGWLRAPSVLTCGEQDWDVIGQGPANRICGAGLTYNKNQKSFEFDFGGEKITITDSALPTDSRGRKDYQASIVSFQAVYLNTDVGAPADASCGAAEVGAPAVDELVRLKFETLSNDDVTVDPRRKPPSLSFWLNKNNYNSQQALLWCLSRCDEEPRCAVADLTDAAPDGFLSCSLFPDSRVCGTYDDPERPTACRHLLDRRPSNTHQKKVDLSGPQKSFYEKVSFQKMVSYSVRSRVSMKETPLSEGFAQCERRCDEDPCCRGLGYIRDTKSAGSSGSSGALGSSDIVCLSLISLGVQTCAEDDITTWRTQDCTPVATTSPDPLGWYQKPVNQWTTSTALCPLFRLPAPTTNVSLDGWSLLSGSAVLVDPSLNTYDVIHISRDIAGDRDRTRDWCLHACQEAESCVAVTLSEVDSATRCVLYPDTTVCGPSSALQSSPTPSCRLVIREPAPQVHLRTGRSPLVTSISIPGHGNLKGVAIETALGSSRKAVVQFLGVPYARPPIGSLRFEAAQPADWTGDWDATKTRPVCLQPGDVPSASSEDCLYLNVFTPAAQSGRVPVLVFFFNPLANQKPGLLDGSTLAAVGDVVVVTASYRTAALGFLTTGSSGLHGNYGLSDQEAVLRWVNAHISLMGGDNSRVTVGAERGGADVATFHLLASPSSPSPPLFHRMMLMGGSAFSPSLVQTAPAARGHALLLAEELGCDITDHDKMAACLRATPADGLNAAQTKLLAVSGPFQAWSPVRASAGRSSFHGVDLLLGTSEHDGLISRARRIKDFEALQGRADGKTAFYEALSRSLGGASGNHLLKEAASWFYSLDHDPSAAGYNLFSRALNNATRDLFIICPSLQMASHWASSNANVFLYHQPETSAGDRAEPSVPLDVQFVFGTPYQPISSQRFTSSERRLSLAVMTYVSSFIRTGNPNPSRLWAESALPHWQQVLSSEATPTYLQLSSALQLQRGLRQKSCSFWSQLGPRLTSPGELGAGPEHPALIPVAATSSQSQTEKDAYS
ncbi:thyroglobulin [Antennarius striatus]|uniref:thyroglobulin n=1 Tax=Antennarius striatus TaxID=241820 RepID=UPI0035B21D8C